MPPLNLPSECGDEDTEAEIELSTPRLRDPLFEKLKRKYPKAFRRRSSALGSETSSICSSLPPTPRSARRQEQEQHNGLLNGYDNSQASNEANLDDTLEGFNDSTLMNSTEDLTISGCKPIAKTTPLQNISNSQDLSMYSNGHAIGANVQGILKTSKGQNEPPPPGSLVKSDSMLSLKERLQKNRENFRDLLDVRLPFKNRKSYSVSGANSSLNITTSTSDRHQNGVGSVPKDIASFSSLSVGNHSTSLPLSAAKPPKPNSHSPRRLTPGNLSIHDSDNRGRDSTFSRNGRPVQKRSIADHVDQRLPYSKRFSSPDSGTSTQDSAVDMDSASLQSSPSSSDNNNTPEHPVSVPQKPVISDTPTLFPLPPSSGRRAPKLKFKRSAVQPPVQSVAPIVINGRLENDLPFSGHARGKSSLDLRWRTVDSSNQSQSFFEESGNGKIKKIPQVDFYAQSQEAVK